MGERIDTRFRGVNRIALSYTHGFNGLLDALDAYDPANTAANAHVSRLGASGEFNKVNVQLQRLQRITQYTSVVLRVDGQFTNTIRSSRSNNSRWVGRTACAPIR